LTTIGIGILATGLIAVAAYLARLDSIIPQYELGIALMGALLTSQVAQSWQGAAIKRHVDAGGKLVSRWIAAAVGLALLVGILAAIVAFALLTDHKVVIGSKDSVHYSAPATQ